MALTYRFIYKILELELFESWPQAHNYFSTTFSGRLSRDIFGAPGKSQNIVNYDDDLMDFKVYDGANVNICLQRDSHPRKVCNKCKCL